MFLLESFNIESYRIHIRIRSRFVNVRSCFPFRARLFIKNAFFGISRINFIEHTSKRYKTLPRANVSLKLVLIIVLLNACSYIQALCCRIKATTLRDAFSFAGSLRFSCRRQDFIFFKQFTRYKRFSGRGEKITCFPVSQIF